MKSVVINTITATAIVGSLFLSNQAAMLDYCGLFMMLGIWSLLYPSGFLGWARIAQPKVDPLDQSIWWRSRVVGVGFIFGALMLAVQIYKQW